MEKGKQRKAFILRMAHGDGFVAEALQANHLITGWAEAKGLLNVNEWQEFREIIRNTLWGENKTLRRAGHYAGDMWRFIHEMKKGDLVVVPYEQKNFYVGEVLEDNAFYLEDKVGEDSAYRRKVKWLNDKKPLLRAIARSALQSRMKIRGSSARAWDLVEHIEECIELAKQDKKPSFAADLRSKLVKRTLDELHTGRIENFGFEYIVKDVLDGLGAFESEIVPRKKDQGVDICATFQAAGFDQYVCIQAKHYKKDPPIGSDVVYELIRGIEEWRDPVAMGMVITSGTFNDEAEKVAEKYEKDNDLPIKLLDGDWLAGCIVDLGLQAIPYCAS